MKTKSAPASAPGFVILQRMPDGQWRLLGEASRKRGLPARAARCKQFLTPPRARPRPARFHAAVLRSEWRIAMDWAPPKGR